MYRIDYIFSIHLKKILTFLLTMKFRPWNKIKINECYEPLLTIPRSIFKLTPQILENVKVSKAKKGRVCLWTNS